MSPILHIFLFSFVKLFIQKQTKLHHLYMYLYLCVWINLYNIIHICICLYCEYLYCVYFYCVHLHCVFLYCVYLSCVYLYCVSSYCVYLCFVSYRGSWKHRLKQNCIFSLVHWKRNLTLCGNTTHAQRYRFFTWSDVRAVMEDSSQESIQGSQLPILNNWCNYGFP